MLDHPRGHEPADHTAVLSEPAEDDVLRRKDDLLDDGVDAVFAVRAGEADLHALCFDAEHFTVEEAREWLLAWGLRPLLFRPAGDV